ncbi:NAD(P)/FAD-dependent oxidoreductase [Oscillochloris sp. ZM17-4]|uniref:NAD(P)/FAD-dependent oxidoreductase n=1 Tax=Oscillochloris sp. ZM17-4 TaxID=2866714 RepID=UPI001C734646|nr:NAD(P)/FAD-dependent oxidoreductase [Oscillochloris sp. ZM17-4]MBX0327719.1 NAD(P)/FAD-dependent oxidoreductase [Oscillochloris sp. ZM17-4]
MATEYVIVGSGVAGIAAAEALRSRAPGASVTVVTEDPDGFYSRPGLAYYLSGTIPEKQLFPRSPADLRDMGLRWVQARATHIDVAGHRLTLADDRTIPYDKLLLATGARAAAPDFPGSDLDGIFTLDTLGDARRLVRKANRSGRAVVVGGGITALELAEGLHACGVRVHYLLRGARYWANVLDAEESHLVEEHLRSDGVEIHSHTRVRQALGKKGKLIAVETDSGALIPCHMLAVAIGTRPHLDLARAAGVKVDRGILTDSCLRTSAPDIFAAGDVAQVYNERSGRASLDTLWPTARAHGEAAAAAMAGEPTPYQPATAMNVTLLAGIPTTIIGALGSGSDEDLVAIARGDSERWRNATPAWVVVEQHAVNRVRLMLGERTITGALVMGDQTLSRPLQRLIAAEADISPIRDSLLADGNTILERIATFSAEWECSHAATP